MRLFRHHSEIPVEARGAVIALGNFDGLHLGHQRVIAAGPISELLLSDDPWLKAYFHGKRGVIRLAGAADRPAALAADDRPQTARR